MPRQPRDLQDQSPPQADIETNNAATGGRPDEPVAERPNSRNAAGDEKRAVAKALGTMSMSAKLGHGPDLDGPHAAGDAARNGAAPARKGLDKGSDKTGGITPDDDVPLRVTRSNAEIAEGSVATARKSPAPRAARTSGPSGTGSGPDNRAKTTGGATQRAPAPGNVVTVPKRQAVEGAASRFAERSTASSGGAKPPKRSARGGHATGAAKSKGADRGLAD